VAERRITFREIRDEELAKAGITLTQFEGDCRHRENVLVRRIIWSRAVKETGLSASAIGRLSGNKDHTSVLRAIIRHLEETTGEINPAMEAYRVLSRRRHFERRAKKRAAALVEG
jgi:chromosomal replication initiation ATPase DnaA